MIDFSAAQYRSILQYMLSQVSDDYDKRDTSPIPTALSPAAWLFTACTFITACGRSRSAT